MTQVVKVNSPQTLEDAWSVSILQQSVHHLRRSLDAAAQRPGLAVPRASC